MKNLLIILALALFSCRKQVEKPPVPLCTTVLNFPESAKPALKIQATVLSTNQVQVSWTKKRNETYTVYRSDGGAWVQVYSCSCGYFQDNVPPGTYSYKVNNSNIVTVIVSPLPTYPEGVIKISFDAYNLNEGSEWSMWVNFTMLESGLAQWQRDSIMAGLNRYYSAFDIVFVTEGAASQTAVLTRSSDWFGSAGGVAFLNSYGTPSECFVFTELLQYNWKNILKALVHELGHTLGLYHTYDLGRANNWMSYVYTIPQEFEHNVMDNSGNYVDQIETINNTLQ